MENKDLDRPITWIEKLLELARKYKITEWLEAFLMLFILGVMITVFTNPGKVIEYFKKAQEEQHIELLQKRQLNSQEAQGVCDRLLYSTGADRVVVLEMHNSVSNLSGLPFLKASCTVESLREDIYPISSQYQATNLSLMPFSSYLYQNGYWSGLTKDMGKYDRSLSYKMLSNNTNYFFGGIIPGKEKAVGFIFISYCGDNRPEDTVKLRVETQKAAMQLGILLELRKEI